MTSIRNYFRDSATHTRHAPSYIQEIDDMDPDTAALIAKLVKDDLEGHMFTDSAAAKGRSRTDLNPLSDEELAYRIQRENFEELLTLADDIKYAQDVSYLEAARAAEVAAYDDRRAAQLLAEGKPMPPLTPAQKLLERPEFMMHPVRNLYPEPRVTGNGRAKAEEPENFWQQPKSDLDALFNVYPEPRIAGKGKGKAEDYRQPKFEIDASSFDYFRNVDPDPRVAGKGKGKAEDHRQQPKSDYDALFNVYPDPRTAEADIRELFNFHGAEDKRRENPKSDFDGLFNVYPDPRVAGKGKGKAGDHRQAKSEIDASLFTSLFNGPPEPRIAEADIRELFNFRDAQDKRRENRDLSIGLKGAAQNHTVPKPDRYKGKSPPTVDDFVPGPSTPLDSGNNSLRADCIICEADDLTVTSAIDAAYKKYYCHNCVVSLITATASTVKGKGKGRGGSEGGAKA